MRTAGSKPGVDFSGTGWETAISGHSTIGGCWFGALRLQDVFWGGFRD